jgi:hypothetical protein
MENHDPDSEEIKKQNVKWAIELVKSRKCRPLEDDWDLLAAAEFLVARVEEFENAQKH